MTPLVAATVRRLGSLAHRRELLATGLTRRQVESSWRAGEILRIRHGLYALVDLPVDVIRAARVGGALAGASSLAHRGAWVPPSPRLVVSVPHNARDLRDPDDAGERLDPDRDDVLVLRDLSRFDRRAERLMASPGRAAAQVPLHEPPEHAAAIVDSALRLLPMQRPGLDEVSRLLATRRSARGLVTMIDPRAESGTESIARLLLARDGIRAEPQVWVDDHTRVDLLIDGWLVLECVSKEHHSSPSVYNRDRERIVHITGLGFVVLEVTYPQVLFDWPSVRQAVRMTLGR
ncbi:type IV toxin-antitoxin system AbiEi family antitoxin domain-containing protein [Frigoribacterium sp. RIT-PI-h]|uniref:type IV toxin-antitoxin system AbiEi family antitoxin domain-containing protein n=1 Tax=Frigoribacterium sp. RIT-PI-h TaxID=1690245 RepID=UPI0006B927C9|nr:type IV toxin-antitoxin system AbiEi family antitoxin domain-containing protein [Frigoribacterium sp. RIT-PI-h]KPG82979.1 hypothetical protein AEQ27_09165 [Frigoribacterium sp. RIT-PI-h]